MHNQALPSTIPAQSLSSTPVTTTHRLAAISASAALQRASAVGSSISCGSMQIDGLLADGANASGGLPRGKVIDLHGPPGVGKTTFGLTAAVNTIRAGGSVVWIDCSAPISPVRLCQIFDPRRPASGPGNKLATDGTNISPDHHQDTNLSANITAENFHHYNAATLAHLLALLLRPPTTSVTPGAAPTTSFPPPNTQLLVLDSLSTLLALAFPYPADLPSSYSSSSSSNATAAAKRQAASARRWAIQRDIAAALTRLAAVRHVSVLVTQQLATRIDRDGMGVRQRAVLKATLGTKSWVEGGIWARVLMCRHWGSSALSERSYESSKKRASDNDDAGSITRFAVLVKLGSTEFEGFGRVVPFGIDESGIIDVNHSRVLHHPKSIDTEAQTIQPRNQNLASLNENASLRVPDRQQSGKHSGFSGSVIVPAKRHAAEIADSESEGEDGGEDVTAVAASGLSDGVELEEVDDFGMTKEEEALLELEMIGAQANEELVPRLS